MKAFEVSLAVEESRAALAWHGAADGGRDAIHLQWLDVQGRAKGAPIQLTDQSRKAYEPDLRLVGGQPILAWYEKDDTGRLSAWLGRFDAQGHPLWRQALGAADAQTRNPVVRERRGVLQVAWIETRPGDNPTVQAARYRLDGKALSPPVLAGAANPDTWNLNAAIDNNGRFLIVYDARLGGRAHELHLSLIDKGRAHTMALSADDGHASLYPDLAISARGQAAVTWFDERDGNQEVYLAVTRLADLTAGRLGKVHRISQTDAPSTGAYLAWNAERLALVWCDSDGGPTHLYARSFSHLGKPTSALMRLTNTDAQSSIPSIRPMGRGFLIGWNDYRLTSAPGAHAQISTSTAMVTTYP